jgi:hypothetical protein
VGDTFVGGDACFLTAVVLIRALPLPLRGLRDDLLLLELLLLGGEAKAKAKAVIVHC